VTTDIRKYYRFAADGFVSRRVADAGPLRCDVTCLEAGQACPPQTDDRPAAIYYVLEGSALFTLGERQEHASAGGLVVAEPGVSRGVSNPGPGRLAVMVVTSES